MDILTQKYEVCKNSPKPIDIEEYFRITIEEYNQLLDDNPLECDFQTFFEKNPAFLPGAFQIIGHTGHAPFLNCLISQPKIGVDVIRKADFMWLATDSLNFCPVLIEIERPCKEQFKKDDYLREAFTHACTQIKHWKALFSNPVVVSSFYERYCIPEYLRKRKISPQYFLVIGRRVEYDCDEMKRGIRSEGQNSDFRIMSFDRLRKPTKDVDDTPTCKVSNGKYRVISLPPTFVYRPDTAENLQYLDEFMNCIGKMEHTSEERKQFLRDRFDYWLEFGKLENNGIIGIGIGDKE